MTLLAEIEILVRYGGLTPADALRAASSVPAEALGYGAELGRVAEGMLADLVVSEAIRSLTSARCAILAS